jgi:hypothetical protein
LQHLLGHLQVILLHQGVAEVLDQPLVTDRVCLVGQVAELTIHFHRDQEHLVKVILEEMAIQMDIQQVAVAAQELLE